MKNLFVTYQTLFHYTLQCVSVTTQVSFHKNCSDLSVIEYCAHSRKKIDQEKGTKRKQRRSILAKSSMVDVNRHRCEYCVAIPWVYTKVFLQYYILVCVCAWVNNCFYVFFRIPFPFACLSETFFRSYLANPVLKSRRNKFF